MKEVTIGMVISVALIDIGKKESNKGTRNSMPYKNPDKES